MSNNTVRTRGTNAITLFNTILILGMLPAAAAAAIFITAFDWNNENLRNAAFQRLSDLHIRYLEKLSDSLDLALKLDFSDPSRFIAALSPIMAFIFFCFFVGSYNQPLRSLFFWVLATSCMTLILATMLFPAV